MLKGEFRFGDGTVVPNNITKAGAKALLNLALRDYVADLAVGLAAAIPAPDLTVAELNEPTIGVNGYQRIALPRSLASWPTEGDVNGDVYLESDWLTWTATGGNFDKSFNRMAIIINPSSTPEVFALSQGMNGLRLITPSTDLSLRRLKYRIYLR
jgi:hypothetical protein